MRLNISVLSILLVARFMHAQDLPRIQHFNKVAYGAENQNWAITQTEEGVMVFANNAGVLTFDGSRWQLISLPQGQVARSVHAQGNRILVGGFNEFAILEPDLKTGFRYRDMRHDGIDNPVIKDEIWHILPSAFNDSSLYYQSFSHIYKFTNGRSVELKPPTDVMFLQNVGKRTLCQGIGRGLYELKEEGSFHFVEGTQTLSGTIVAFIVPLSGDSILVGTRNHGLFVVSGKICKPWSSRYNNMLRTLQPNKAVQLKNGGLAIGTVLDGVFIFDSQMQLQYHFNQTNGLQDNTVLSMYVDKAGGLWLGLDEGIDRISLHTQCSWYNDITGRIGSVYAAVLHRRKLYIGTNHGVYWRYFDHAGQPFQLIEGTQGLVWHLQAFNDQIICGHNEGTYLINNDKATLISNITGGWQTLQVPGRPDLLLQCTYSGLIVFGRRHDGKWQFSHRVTGLNEPIRQIRFDKDGQLWAVHPNSGLWRITFDPEFKTIRTIKRYGPNDGIERDVKMEILEWRDTLLVKSGPMVWAYTKQGFIPYKLSVPLDGPLLMLPHNHLAVARPNELILQTGGKLISWPLNMVKNYPKIEVIDSTHLLFCLENGFAMCRLTDLLQPPQLPHRVRVRFLEVISNPPERIYTLDKAPPIRLTATQNNLIVNVSPPDFEGSNYIEWQLNGRQVRWGLVDQSGKFELNGLSPGRYTLSLACYDHTTTLDFEVMQHWWLRWWALLLWALALLGLIVFVEMHNRRRIQRRMAAAHEEYLQALELQKIKADKERLEKEQLLESQLRQAENRRLLNELDSKNRELSNLTLSLIRKNELLADLKTKLKAVAKENDKIWPIIRAIDHQIADDNEWAVFEDAFNQVHDAFFKKIKQEYPQLSTGDLRLAALLKLNLNSKEIAAVLGISVRGIENKRYRLRKKLGLTEDVNLAEWLIVY